MFVWRGKSLRNRKAAALPYHRCQAATHPCAVHEGGATAVEVEEAAVRPS